MPPTPPPSPSNPPNPWSSAEEHAERAREFFQAGQWEKALVELQAALAVNPDQSDWHQAMGMTLDALQRHEQAIASYEQVLRLRQDDIATLLNLSVDLIRTDRPAEAVTRLEQVNRIDPNCEPGYCYRIAAYAQMQEHDQAEVMFYLARQVQDQCPLCYDHLGHSLWQQGRIDRAIWCWQQALELEPNFPQAHVWLARANWKKGQHAQAHQHYLNHLRQEPGDVAAIYELGTLLMEMDQTAQASEKFRRILELDPRSAKAHLRLAVIAIHDRHLESAEAELNLAEAEDGSLAGLWLRRAQVAWMKGQRQETLAHLQRELKRSGHTPNHRLDMIRLLLDLRQPRLAMELMPPMDRAGDDSSVSPSGENTIPDPAMLAYRANLLLYRGVAWMLMNRSDQAARDFRRTLGLTPDNEVALHNLILAYAQNHRYARARCFLARALAIQPQDRELRRLKTRLRLGQIGHRCRRLIQRIKRRFSGFSRRSA